MSSYDYGRYDSQSHSHAPSAPPQPQDPPYTNSPPPPSSSNYQYATPYTQTPSNAPPPSNYHYGGQGYGQVSSSAYYSSSSLSSSAFPPGTHPDVITSFQMVDRDRSGYIDEKELQRALSSAFHNFSIGTIRLLMFLFKHPNEPLRIGPKEFAALWSCLGHWRGIFERYDKDRSGKIDPLELRDALYGIGYAVPGSVLQLLLSKYSSDGSGKRVELGFDCFVECGMIIKGLTDKFKEKDRRYTGSATLSYDDFMSMVIPFLVSYD